MTIPGFGRITPMQGDMLLLAGYRLTPSPELNEAPIPDEEREQLMCDGLRALRRATAQDFGFDLSAWEQYLMSRLDSGYCHSYAFATTRTRIAAAIADPERARIVEELAKGGAPEADRKRKPR
jgi:hypothetical protein